GMGGGGGMGGMGGGQPIGSTLLPRLVRNLATIQMVQDKGLTPQQSAELSRILMSIQAADKLPAKECDEKIAEIEKILTEPQKQALKDLTPQRGGGGGGGRGGGGGGMMSAGRPASAGGTGAPGGFGGGPGGPGGQ